MTNSLLLHPSKFSVYAAQNPIVPRRPKRRTTRKQPIQAALSAAEWGIEPPGMKIAHVRFAPIQRSEEDVMLDIRQILLAQAEDPIAPQTNSQRLAVHCINTSVALTFLPIGAALIIYSTFRKEDIRLTASLTALAGIALGFGDMGPVAII